ncbi:LOW QUALITY PROTEIN: hypothetical protein CRUP_031505 [Coryphaenoides rupestris]|nr:LOW QUALITY PROTEIN: hypothetical protein CRUP_031505 [Coryphaenoides rupestris]
MHSECGVGQVDEAQRVRNRVAQGGLESSDARVRREGGGGRERGDQARETAEKGAEPQGQRARLLSPAVGPELGPLCLLFYYQLQGEAQGSLRVLLRDNEEEETLLWALKGEQGPHWREGRTILPQSPREYQGEAQGSLRVLLRDNEEEETLLWALKGEQGPHWREGRTILPQSPREYQRRGLALGSEGSLEAPGLLWAEPFPAFPPDMTGPAVDISDISGSELFTRQQGGGGCFANTAAANTSCDVSQSKEMHVAEEQDGLTWRLRIEPQYQFNRYSQTMALRRQPPHFDGGAMCGTEPTVDTMASRPTTPAYWLYVLVGGGSLLLLTSVTLLTVLCCHRYYVARKTPTPHQPSFTGYYPPSLTPSRQTLVRPSAPPATLPSLESMLNIRLDKEELYDSGDTTAAVDRRDGGGGEEEEEVVVEEEERRRWSDLPSVTLMSEKVKDGAWIYSLDPILLTIIVMSSLGVVLGAVCAGLLLYCTCSYGGLSSRSSTTLENYNFELYDGIKHKVKINQQRCCSEA